MKLKTIILPIIAAFSIYLTSCGSGSGYGGDGCMGGCTYQESGKKLGEVLLNDSNKYWLNFAWYRTSAKFSNVNGYLVHSKVYKNSGTSQQFLNSYTRVNDNPCCPTTQVKDFINVGRDIVTYEPEDEGVHFTIKRAVNVGAKIVSKDSVEITSKQEVLLLEANGTWYTINPDTAYSSNNQKYHSSIKLDGYRYYSVFEIIDNNIDSTKILPKGFYVVLEGGIVGYYLSNGELWTIR